VGDILLRQTGLSIHDAPDERLEPGAVARAPHAADFLGGCRAIGGTPTAAGSEHERALREISEHTPHGGFVVVAEAPEHLVPASRHPRAR
jgi:hypothetical protein